MGKWAARLIEISTAPPVGTPDKTAERGVLSVLTVIRQDVAAEFQAPAEDASRPTDLPSAAESARSRDRRGRLVRWGWPAPEAERLAARLLNRDREQDDRVSCADCAHYTPRRCGNHRRAGFCLPALGRDLASQLQRCPGFEVVWQPAKRNVAAPDTRSSAAGTLFGDDDPTA